jgi:hypothetical protein
LRSDAAATLLGLDVGLAVEGNVLHGGEVEQWIACTDPQEAERLATRLRKALSNVEDARVATGEPRPSDAACWELLRFAGDADGTVVPGEAA